MEQIAPHVTTGQLGSYVSGTGSAIDGSSLGLEVQRLAGEEDGGRTWTLAGRAFASTGTGLTVFVDCHGGDIATTVAEVVRENTILITA